MIKAIVFDVGGVLIDYEDVMCYDYVSRVHKVDRKRYVDMIERLSTHADRGDITARELESKVSDAFGIPINGIQYDAVLEIEGSCNDKVMDIARSLSKKYMLAILSDVSAGRWAIAKRMIDTSIFHKKFLSYKMRATKPSRKVYMNVIAGLKIKPNEIIFTDNLQRNVDGARKIGINAIRYRNPARLKRDISRLLKIHNGANSW